MRQAIYKDTKLIIAEELHIVRPINYKQLKKILKRKNIKEISVSPSCFKRLSRKVKELLRRNKIPIRIKTFRGRTIGIPLNKITTLIELVKDDISYREIEKITGIPKSTIHYLVRKAAKTKIKNGNNVIYLK